MCLSDKLTLISGTSFGIREVSARLLARQEANAILFAIKLPNSNELIISLINELE